MPVKAAFFPRVIHSHLAQATMGILLTFTISFLAITVLIAREPGAIHLAEVTRLVAVSMLCGGMIIIGSSFILGSVLQRGHPTHRTANEWRARTGLRIFGWALSIWSIPIGLALAIGVRFQNPLPISLNDSVTIVGFFLFLCIAFLNSYESYRYWPRATPILD